MTLAREDLLFTSSFHIAGERLFFVGLPSKLVIVWVEDLLLNKKYSTDQVQTRYLSRPSALIGTSSPSTASW